VVPVVWHCFFVVIVAAAPGSLHASLQVSPHQLPSRPWDGDHLVHPGSTAHQRSATHGGPGEREPLGRGEPRGPRPLRALER